MRHTAKQCNAQKCKAKQCKATQCKTKALNKKNAPNWGRVGFIQARRHVFRLNKTFLLAAPEDMASVTTRRSVRVVNKKTVFLLTRKTCLMVEQEDKSACLKP